MEGMSEDARAEDWRLPESARPPLLGELVGRIDEALSTARAAEAAVMTVGAAALDAAEQAKRAAELAERASAALAGNRALDPPARPRHGGAGEAGAGMMDDFATRADELTERLRRLQRVPLSA